jgi:hypothetical protein
MHTFAVTVLLGLALVKILDVVEESVPRLSRVRGSVTVALALAGVYALDYSMFEGFGVSPREDWMGPLFTGLIVAGTTALWAGLLRWLGTPEGREAVRRRQQGNLVGKAA